MGKRGRILVVAAAIIVVGAVGWAIIRAQSGPPDPIYKGKPLSYWLRGYIQSPWSTNIPSPRDAQMAVREVGTNAIPLLLRRLRAYDSPLKVKLLTWVSQHPMFKIQYTNATILNVEGYYGFQTLGPRAAGAVPELIEILDEHVSDRSVALTAGSLAWIGPESKSAIPAMLRAAKGTNADVHNSVFHALGVIHEDPAEVVPVLTAGLRDPYPLNREVAAGALGNFKGDARSAIPALISALSDPNLQASDPALFTNVHIQVEGALRRIDPETYARVVTNTATGPNK